jgi:prepilin-type N-terminal cleavage/methylation domain-containing protein
MKNTKLFTKRRPGFTLLEVIVTIIIASIMATMLVTYMGNNLIHSTEPVIMVQRNVALTRVMENIANDYKVLMVTDLTPLATLSTRIQNGNINDPADSWPDFGYYNVVTCTQETGLESGDYSQILRVTISSGDQRLTALFTQ